MKISYQISLFFVAIVFLFCLSSVFIFLGTSTALATQLSNFGSFLGGFLGAVLSFISLIIVITSMAKQNQATIEQAKITNEIITEQSTQFYLEAIDSVYRDIEKQLKTVNESIDIIIEKFDSIVDICNRSPNSKPTEQEYLNIVTLVNNCQKYSSTFENFFYVSHGLFYRINRLSIDSYSRMMLSSIVAAKYSTTMRKFLCICMIQLRLFGKEVSDEQAQGIGIRLKYYSVIQQRCQEFYFARAT